MTSRYLHHNLFTKLWTELDFGPKSNSIPRVQFTLKSTTMTKIFFIEVKPISLEYSMWVQNWHQDEQGSCHPCPTIAGPIFFWQARGKTAAVKNAPALLPIMVHSANHLNTNANLNKLKREMLFKINEFPVKDATFKSKQSKKKWT